MKLTVPSDRSDESEDISEEEFLELISTTFSESSCSESSASGAYC